MASVTKSFLFHAALESWAATVGAATTGARSTSQNSPNDSGGSGSLSHRIYGKNKTNAGNYWQWAGTYADLGVPANSRITEINLAYDWICSEYTTGSGTNRTGPAEIRNAADTLRATLSNAQGSVSGTTSWATVAGSTYSGLSEPETTTIHLRITTNLATGNSASAAVTLNHDYIIVTITYTPIDVIPAPPEMYAGAPTVGAPALLLLIALTATAITMGSTTVGSPDLNQRIALTADPITMGAPTVGAPALGFSFPLVADDLTTGIVSIPQVELTQVVELVADDLDTGNVQIEEPALQELVELEAVDLDSGAAALDEPEFGQVHELEAEGVDAGAVAIDDPELKMIRSLVADDLTMDAATVGIPSLSSGLHLVPDTMPVRIFDLNLNLVAEIDDYESLYFSRLWYAIGEFSITMNANKRYAGELKRGRIVLLKNYPDSVGIITQTKYTVAEGGRGSETITASGFELKHIFKWRIAIPPTGEARYMDFGIVETILKTFVAAQCGEGADAARRFPNFSITEDQGRGGEYLLSARYSVVADELIDAVNATNVSPVLGLDTDTRQIVFDVAVGVDRRRSQAVNARAIFTTDYDNVKSAEVTHSDVNYRSMLIVGGQGSGPSRTILRVALEAVTTGFGRRELWIDARDLSSTADLLARGQQKAEAYSNQDYVDAVALAYASLKYRRDYDLGDLVSVRVRGEYVDSRISGVRESWTHGNYDIELTFGKPYPSISGKVAQGDAETAATLNANE